MNQDQILAINALKQAKGDDLIRAQRSFAKLTVEEMHNPWGSSTITPTNIISEYEERDRKIDAAIEWVKSQ